MEIINLILNNTKQYKQLDDLKNNFLLPIETIDDKIKINNSIIEDLELKEDKKLKNEDVSNNLINNLYCSLLNPENIFEKNILSRWSNYYTNNKDYLIDTQNLLKNYKGTVTFNEINNHIDNTFSYQENIITRFEEVINDNGFIQKYQYIDLPFFDKYNNNELCLQALSVNNLCAPIISIIIPIIFLILPFFIIKIQGHNITLDMYLKHLKIVFSNHIIGKFINDFSSTSITSKIYLLFSLGFYLFQIYQNILSSSRFYNNINYIIDTLKIIKDYINNSIYNFNNLLKFTSEYTSYSNFNKSIQYNKNILNNFSIMLKDNFLSKNNVNKLFNLGYLLKCFYKLYNDENLISSIYYSFSFNGFTNNINNIQKLLKINKINYCNFIDNTETSKKTMYKNAYYGKLLQDTSNNIIKNNYTLNNNLTLTGPNAAGKTTLLKTTLFNTLLCQQIGCGFFDKANVKIYDFIHCYINIPDTSDRDSLFQAEARRCKEILSSIEENKEKLHLCVFDEIYSGTNPVEAVKSAYSYLNYLNKLDNVNYILTTHYYKLCKKLESDTNHNYHMSISKSDNKFIFKYKIKKGISKIKGGIKVLEDLNYPEHIIKNIENK